MKEQTGNNSVGRVKNSGLMAGVLLLGCLLWLPKAHAVNGQCTSPFVATGPITTTGTLYQPGDTGIATAFSTTSSATCDCTGISVGLLVTVYYQATTSLPTVSDPLGTLIKLNSYFGLKAEFNAAGTYRTVPFNATSSGLLAVCIGNVVNLALGGIDVNGGRYTLKLLKGVTGTQTFSGTVAYLFVRRSSAPDTSPANAFSQLAMNISVTSTPSCQFPAGTSIPIDLGAVAQSAFIEGEVPRGYTPRSVNVSVTCSQIPSDYVVPLSYRFGGALTSQNRFITTSLAGVGVGMLEQGSPTPIPFDTAIAVPYSAATHNTNYQVRLYPTRLPGQVVRTGAYTGTIMVTVSVP
ncbi:fimbrial protein [Aeromonas sp. sia0103]|uniref:fimbrial protein n=1 Tax=Aeromonas sp. sia0103 TaxID=2854782 RepID=UPI001C47849E|nr:fimbrial protein [Aeromonas sp. sia0103]MBV7596417.1 fimbrial protein [Aeromonas sp. sia0103]